MKNHLLLLSLALFINQAALHASQNIEVSIAAARGDINELKRLMASGIKIAEATDCYGASALMHAIAKKQFETVRWLVLEAGVSVNKVGTDKMTPLTLACMEKDNHDIIAFLLEQPGIDIYAESNNGLTAFKTARFNEDYIAMLKQFESSSGARAK